MIRKSNNPKRPDTRDQPVPDGWHEVPEGGEQEAEQRAQHERFRALANYLSSDKLAGAAQEILGDTGELLEASKPLPPGFYAPTPDAAFFVPGSADAYAAYWIVEDGHSGALGDTEDVVRRIHAHVAQQLDDYERVTGRRPVVVAPGTTIETRRLSVRDYVAYAHTRARELGFDPAELFAKQQGRRATRYEQRKAARAQIARELKKHGLTLGEVGEILGGLRPSTVHELLMKAREENDDGNS